MATVSCETLARLRRSIDADVKRFSLVLTEIKSSLLMPEDEVAIAHNGRDIYVDAPAKLEQYLPKEYNDRLVVFNENDVAVVSPTAYSFTNYIFIK